MLLGTFWGTGAQLVGYQPCAPRTFEAQRWITVLYVPLIPVDAWEVEPQRLEAINLGAVVGERLRFRVVGRVPLRWRRVLAIYAAVLAVSAVALIPFLLVVPGRRGPQPALAVLAMMAAIVWPIVALAWVNHRRERLYERG